MRPSGAECMFYEKHGVLDGPRRMVMIIIMTIIIMMIIISIIIGTIIMIIIIIIIIISIAITEDIMVLWFLGRLVRPMQEHVLWCIEYALWVVERVLWNICHCFTHQKTCSMDLGTCSMDLVWLIDGAIWARGSKDGNRWELKSRGGAGFPIDFKTLKTTNQV